MSTRQKIVSRKDLHEMMQRDDDFTLVEVLAENDYEKGHLPGAINIPGDRLRAEAPKSIPDRNATVVVYCASPSCTASDRAAELLTDMGYTDVRDYRGGKEHWKEGGLKVTTEKMAATA